MDTNGHELPGKEKTADGASGIAVVLGVSKAPEYWRALPKAWDRRLFEPESFTLAFWSAVLLHRFPIDAKRPTRERAMIKPDQA
jgi:hypothetical protein